MQSLVLKKLQLISTVEKAARQVEFDPHRTLIYGGNQTGKSSVVKSIYWTFGAEPAVLSPKWERADVSAVLWFTVDNNTRALLRHKSQFAIFDENARLIRKFSKVTTELAPYLAQLFAFKLQLSRAGQSLTPPPAFLFLPYYVDQDASWENNWASFKNLSQFSNWKKDVAEYHVGVRPGEYYEAKGQRGAIETAQKEAGVEQKIINAVIDKIRLQFNSSEFDIDIKEFQSEIDRLVAVSNVLLKQENEFKSRFAELHSERGELVEQVNFAHRAAADLDSDYRFATKAVPESEVHCPVCGTTYENSFAERFALAADEDKVVVLISEITNRIAEIDFDLAKLQGTFEKNSASSREIQQLLQQKRQTVTLAEVLKREGKREANSALNARNQELTNAIVAFGVELKELNSKLKGLTNKKRVDDISQFYLSRMRSFLIDLHVPTLHEQSYRRFESKIRETGSSRPRALLAYYFSILFTVQKFGDGTFCPVVIDSPNQQAQDPQI